MKGPRSKHKQFQESAGSDLLQKEQTITNTLTVDADVTSWNGVSFRRAGSEAKFRTLFCGLLGICQENDFSLLESPSMEPMQLRRPKASDGLGKEGAGEATATAASFAALAACSTATVHFKWH